MSSKPIHFEGGSGVSYARIARKTHRCTCGRKIAPGDAHLEHVAFPGHLAVGGDRPERLRECAPCAVKYGRDYYLDIPTEQAYRQGLV